MIIKNRSKTDARKKRKKDSKVHGQEKLGGPFYAIFNNRHSNPKALKKKPGIARP